MKDLRYPIGKFEKAAHFGPEERRAAIEAVRNFPILLQDLLSGLSGDDWQRTYRPGSWNVAQLTHHCADSHMNCFIRFKLALTEENPTIKPYDENAWTQQQDYALEFVQNSVEISRGVHARWSSLMEHMTDDQWKREFFHPEQKKLVNLSEALEYYSWHCRHHLSHLQVALKKTSFK